MLPAKVSLSTPVKISPLGRSVKDTTICVTGTGGGRKDDAELTWLRLQGGEMRQDGTTKDGKRLTLSVTGD